MKSLLARFRWLYIAPVLAVIALTAWALASPMGASPDDDFHLASVWCASGNEAANCTEGTAANNRMVPEALLESACYLPKSTESAACQRTSVDFDPNATVLSERGNFVGGYPPLYYATMGLFVGSNILASVVVMRIVSVLIFVGLTSALFVLLPRPRRSALMWGWLVTTVPLGLFLIPSNNPSSWAIIGVGTSWLALLGWFETTGRRKIGLGIVFALGTLVAAGSRGDSAVYAGLGIAIVMALAFSFSKKYFRDAILPLVLLAVCVYFFITAQQVISGFNGFGGTVTAETPEARDPLGLVAFNILNIPTLWAGVFGSWGLGWLEVGMPGIVAFGSLACFIAVAAIGFGRLYTRKALALAVVGLTLIALPVIVLTRGGDIVGEEVQPRYLLPLIVMFAGILLLRSGGRIVEFSRGQVILIVTTLSVTQFVALHVTMRRYITGIDNQGWNLNSGIEWWWNIPFSPMVVLLVGSLAYAGLVTIVTWEITRGPSAIGASADMLSDSGRKPHPAQAATGG